MGTLSDGLLGFAFGAGTTLSNEFDRQNKESALIRAEDRGVVRAVDREKRASVESDRIAVRGEGYAIAAENRRIKAENAKLDYMEKLKLKGAADLNTQELRQLRSGESAELAADTIDRQRDIADRSITEGINITTAGAKTKEELRLKREDDIKRRELGLPTSRTATVGVDIKDLSIAEVKDVLKGVATRTLGESPASYLADLKKNDIPTITKTLKAGSDKSRELVGTILNGAAGEGDYLDMNPVEMLNKEIAHITLQGLGTKAKHASKKKDVTITVPDLEESGRGAVAKADEVSKSMIKAWTRVDQVGYVDTVASSTGKTRREVMASIVNAEKDNLREILGLTQAESGNSIIYQRIWNIYKRPLQDLMTGKYEPGLVTGR